MLFDKDIQAFLCSSKPVEAKAFYRDKLGLMLLSEDETALEFRANGIALRIVIVKDFQAQATTALGWKVKEISEIIKSLNGKEIFCEQYEFLQQDKQGIWKSRNGTKVAWFKDPDGNILSISA